MITDFYKVGEVVKCSFKGGYYERVGSIKKFTFTQKVSSRRVIRELVKLLESV